MKKIYTLEGKNIYDLDSFFSEFAKVVNAPNGYFGRNLTGFDDCLFGGFGLEAPCEIIWKNSNISKQRLDSEMLKKYYEEEKEWFEESLIEEINSLLENGVNPDDYDITARRGIKYSTDMIEKAMKGEMTMFDDVVRTIQSVTRRAHYEWVVDLSLK